MAYILVVNPDILSATGMSFEKVFSATAISSAIATLIMALLANLPFALAPGMGLNAFFAFSVVLGMGYSWQLALTAVFIEGIIFIILTFVNIREAIINSIPANLKKAIGVGIGFFIAFIGLQNAGIIVDNTQPSLLSIRMVQRRPELACSVSDHRSPPIQGQGALLIDIVVPSSVSPSVSGMPVASIFLRLHFFCSVLETIIHT